MGQQENDKTRYSSGFYRFIKEKGQTRG